MEFSRIRTPNDKFYSEAMKIYGESFSIHEQRELESQISILQNDEYHFDVVVDEGKLIGAILYWEIGQFIYVEHFFIEPSMRNKHYGERILSAMKGKPVILEIDPPVDEMAVHRRNFYLRCGFVENTYKHVHPPYHRDYAGHDLIVMSSPEVLTPEEYGRFNRYLTDTIMQNTF